MKGRTITVKIKADPKELEQRQQAIQVLRSQGFPDQMVDAYLWRCGLDWQIKAIQKHKEKEAARAAEDKVIEDALVAKAKNDALQ